MDHIWVPLFLFLGNVIGFLYQWFREVRNHRWQVENMNQLKNSVEDKKFTCQYAMNCENVNCPARESYNKE